MINGNFPSSHADLILSKVQGDAKGQRRIDVDEFMKALHLIASKKGVDLEAVYDTVARAQENKIATTMNEKNENFHKMHAAPPAATIPLTLYSSQSAGWYPQSRPYIHSGKDVLKITGT